MAASRMNSTRNIFRRYKVFFYLCIVILAIQLFLGYSFYTMNQDELKRIDNWRRQIDKKLQLLSTGTAPAKLPHQPQDNAQQMHVAVAHPLKDNLDKVPGLLKDSLKRGIAIEELDPEPPYKCEIKTSEALSAISRAKTNSCKEHLSKIACLSQQRKLFPTRLPRSCPVKGEYRQGEYLGCYKDTQKDRDLSRFNMDYREDNSPQKCIDFCLRGGYLYAGVQYHHECWCGISYGKHGSLPETSCKMTCPGNNSEICGGYNAQRVFSTGLPPKKSKTATLVYNSTEVQGLRAVRIVFVLTVTGRAVRQVKRLLKTIYYKQHYYYIHVDSRQSYLFQELLKLEAILPNVRLARERFATIWGGASLLKAHFVFLKSLLSMTDWNWDYYINLSESDYPIKNITSLTWFLQKYQGNSFLKSNGRETPTFIKKQGMDQNFYECDNHLWRLGTRELPSGIRYDGGSDWICLDRKFSEYAIFGSDPLLEGLKKLFNYTLLPVESFFHILLLNSEFCEKWVDNNLHLTNWKRKQGCKCQYKHIVDWCGCSPNDLKPDDFDKILLYSAKATFFARKFEAIISQEILNSVDSHLGITHPEAPSLKYYWQNEFHSLDRLDSKSDVIMTFGDSFIRHVVTMLSTARADCAFTNIKLVETHVLYVADSFYRYLVKYTTTLPGSATQYTLESQFSYTQHYKVIDPSGIIGRLQSLEVGTDFDPKELIFRNYPGFIGPNSEVGVRHVWGYGTPGVVTFAFVDPAGDVASFQDVQLGRESLIEIHKPRIRTPLRPGVWTVIVMYQLRIAVSVEFLVLPFASIRGIPVNEEEVKRLHNGPDGPYTQDLNEFQGKLKVTNPEELKAKAVINGKKFGKDLLSWIDDLTPGFWKVLDTCSQEDLGSKCPLLNLCSQTMWSSLSPDPKSEIKGLDYDGNIR